MVGLSGSVRAVLARAPPRPNEPSAWHWFASSTAAEGKHVGRPGFLCKLRMRGRGRDGHLSERLFFSLPSKALVRIVTDSPCLPTRSKARRALHIQWPWLPSGKHSKCSRELQGRLQRYIQIPIFHHLTRPLAYPCVLVYVCTYVYTKNSVAGLDWQSN